jgi:hypothetical protein
VTTDTPVNGDLRWLTPTPLLAGVFAGPVAWATDLVISYVLVDPACKGQHVVALHATTFVALAVTAAGAVIAWRSLLQTPQRPTDGGDPIDRARFMAVLGLASSAFFGAVVIAEAIPRWVLDACR